MRSAVAGSTQIRAATCGAGWRYSANFEDSSLSEGGSDDFPGFASADFFIRTQLARPDFQISADLRFNRSAVSSVSGFQ